ncbi:PD-(D/E)XK nuclease family protein [Luteolibacter pohnpeiensis]|uniref:PD-(D/E)XK nuclease family protein n=1 Tax=Luteolibacter pohnpeiensis TaxID=454153 RepID=A0A934SAT0_9BACT|nr:PD-(D/E)XK nuclease family protein [Luteolibacter pohnpeiensis]MBK1884071.1 PD-(D/E)XK nuclease family protein [Luteolibacter pohnpeiensis]
MVERVFLGWDEPFLFPAANWLIQQQAELPGALVLVPTAQSGRRLRETLAELSGAILSPQVTTPGSLLQINDLSIAPPWLERLAWTETLEQIQDWTEYSGLFPEPPGEGKHWGGSLASEFTKLRKSLQDNGLTIQTAAYRLRDTVEEERWDALTRLENLVEAKLNSWSLQSRSRVLASGLALPNVSRIILAGISSIPPILATALRSTEIRVTALIGAPAEDTEHFSDLGIPLQSWSGRAFPWPESATGTVTLAADPSQQAQEAVRAAAKLALPSDQIALGSADTEPGEELERAFTRAGWTAFHPAKQAIASGLERWLKVWTKWIEKPALSVMADLLSLPETGILVGGRRAQKAEQLAKLRDRWMVQRIDELALRLANHHFRSDAEKELADEVFQAARKLEGYRTDFLGKAIAPNLRKLLEILSRCGPATAEQAATMIDWLASASPFIEQLDRNAGYWIDLMISEQPTPTPQPPDGRVIDVQGWLELFHEPGQHLILCGLNEGKVPANSGGEPWLSETIRKRIGLTGQADFAARDAFLLTAMIQMRRKTGKVDLICGKVGSGGETLLPSRLLLAAPPTDLPRRVRHLFREIEPPEAGLRWQADWQWAPRIATPPTRLRVTAISDFLRCPFRFYLKHVLGMQRPEPNRTEWHQRDFGTVAHDVVERWGRDLEARDSMDAAEIEAWLSAELDRVLAEWFGKKIPLAVRIQTEAMRQRLAWMAQVQAEQRAQGWKIIDVERPLNLQIDGMPISAKIDRIDRHESTGRLRVIDYKTGRVSSVDRSHRSKITASTKVPVHFGDDSAAFIESMDRGKPARYFWTNLQLPLYAAGLVQSGEGIPTPCYFTLGGTEADVGLHEWESFEAADLDAALNCAGWVAEQIRNSNFLPAAEKVDYDDYSILSAGKPLEEMIAPLAEWRKSSTTEEKP